MAVLYVRVPDQLHAALTGISARLKRPLGELVVEGLGPYVQELARSNEVRVSQEQFESSVDEVARLVELANKMTRESSGKRSNT